VIDNKEIKNKEILQSLQSSDIRSVEIDRSPSAAYAANVRAVIRIKTIENLKDNLYLKVSNTASLNRELSMQPSLQFKIKKGILSSMLTYGFSDMNNVINESYFRHIYYPDYAFSSLSDAKLHSNNQINRLLWATDIDLTPRNRIGVQYFYRSSQMNQRNSLDNRITDQATTTGRIIDQANNSLGNLHSISLNYNYDINENSFLSLITDYASRRNDGNESTDETNLETRNHSQVKIRNNSTYDIFTHSITYRAMLPYAIPATVGYQYSNVHNPSDVTTRHAADATHEQTKLDDQIHAGFFNLTKEFDKFNLQLGLRYEYARTKIGTRPADGNDGQVNRSYSDFFPNMEIDYKINDDWDLSLSFSKYIDRPGFVELNPSVFYDDSLSYISGNPLVKPSYNHEISLGANWKGVSLSVSYANIKDARTQTYIKDEGNTNITRMIPINISRSEMWNANLMYTFTKNKLSAYFSLGTDMAIQDIPFLDEVMKVNKLSWNTSANCEYAINGKFKLHGDFFYNSARQSLLTYQYSTNGLNVGLTMSFLKNRLVLDLSGTDLLYGSNFSNLYNKYLNIESGTHGKGDFRGVRLNVSYVLFNSNRVSIKSQRGNDGILERAN
jgi:outer membrane receptor protein involved in Fe transport